MGTNYRFDTCRIEKKDTMSKKKLLSFRTSEENDKYLRELMESDDRSMSYIISKMIDAFRTRGVEDTRDIK